MENNLPTEPALPEEEISAPRQSKKWYIIGAILVVFLAAAVFLGMRLIKSPSGLEGMGEFGPSKGFVVGKGGAQGKSVRLNMTPAKELPAEKPSVSGIFVRQEDKSIFIGTGNVMIAVKKTGSGSDVSAKYNGPVVEVVVNHDTKIYQDITEMPMPDQAKDGEVKVDQVVKPGSLDDLGENSLVTVWGDKQGDRFVARVITFR